MISLRGHHILCFQGFRGKGYSETFIDNFSEIVDKLNKHPNTLVKVNKNQDLICASCPHDGNTKCLKSANINDELEIMDSFVLRKLRLGENQVYPLYEILNRSKNVFKTQSDVKECCGMCSWQNTCAFYQSLQHH